MANPTGFCFGVRRAIEALEDILTKRGLVYCIGMPIHNPQEVDRLVRKGLVVVDSPELVPPSSQVFVRAHGISPTLFSVLKQRSTCVIDGTCPFVKKAQERAKHLAESGYLVCIVGDASHPEVKALLGTVGGHAIVVRNINQAKDIGKISKLGVISQTTQDEKDFSSIVAELTLHTKDMRIYNTICNATRARQNATRELAKVVEGIIVIGGRNSANTGKLYDIAKSTGVDVVWIEHAQELDRGWLSGKARIGIAAGASTPDWLIHQLKQTMAIT
ncbi:4-hydroxy-3-methylbut-2-enyl diphosphate reductase [Aminobacterium mobile]|uniref:4-hydroxy-3-methylbut-2-enyl diphosphate reductase n=1 Tax=Aminobacterium mobile TaxID=81467 RepID=UPI0030846B9C